MKNKLIDVVCLGVTVITLGTVALVNLIQPNRPTVSENEKRTLATMPEFSFESFTSGSYFAGISTFVSDTFIGRETLVGYQKKIDTLRGVNYAPNGASGFVVLHSGGETKTETDDKTTSKLAEALEKLKEQEPKTTDDDIREKDDSEKQVLPPDEDQNDIQKKNITHVLDNGEGIGSQTAEEGTVRSLSLSKDALKLTVGSGSAVFATVDAENGATVRWSLSDKNIAEIVINPDGGVDVKALAAGSCTLRCVAGGKSASCEVTIAEINTVSENQNADNADFLTDGLFIYGDAVYTQGAFSYNNAKNYADTALYYKNLFGENTRMSIVIAPVSSMVIDNPEITKLIPDQKAAMESMAALCDPSVNFVDTYSEMYQHRDEYLYFKTDHHWTARGAYYAYAAFAKSVGFEPTPLDGFDYVLKNEYYQGSMYSYTLDERVKSFYDKVEAFVPRKKCTMTITTRAGTTETYDSSVVSFNNTYVSFIAGDNPYTVINVPDNPQDKNVLVLKDSFGNGFVPFLCEHYGNIIVVDTRYSSFNIYDELKDYGFCDIIFVNNIQAANSPAWSRLYLAAVGVN